MHAARTLGDPAVLSWRDCMAVQDGVLARWQALAGGMTPEAWEWKLASGRWRRALPGVALTHTGEPSGRQRAWAACLHGGHGSAVSGDAALRLRGMKGDLGTALDLVVPAARQVRAAALFREEPFRVRRTNVAEGARAAIAGLPVLDAHHAVLHAAAWARSDRAAEWRIAAAVQQRLTAPTRLRAVLATMPRLHRRALVRVVLDDVELGAHAGSELAYLRFCRRHGLPVPDALQVRVRAGGMAYLDGRYVRQRVSLELDGTHHMAVGQWEADALRSLRLAVALPGERQVRLTMGNLRHDGAEVAALLHVLLD